MMSSDNGIETMSRDEDRPRSYESAHEHLVDLLTRHDWVLRRQLARTRACKPTDILGFAAITEAEVNRLLSMPPSDSESSKTLEEIDLRLHALQARINHRVQQTPAAARCLPVHALANRFSLSSLELDLLICCLAPEIDRRYERVYGYLHDDMSRKLPSAGLALELYCRNDAERLHALGLLRHRAPLRHYGLVELIEDSAATSGLARSMRIDERIASFLLGEDCVDEHIARYLICLDSSVEALKVCAGQRGALDALSTALGSEYGASPRKRMVAYFQGSHLDGTDALVQLAARELETPLLAIHAELLLATGADFEHAMFRLFREALLSRASVYLRGVDRLLEHDSGDLRWRALLRCIEEMGTMTFLSGESSWSWSLQTLPVALHCLEVRRADFMDQLRAWRAVAPERITESELHELISLHPLPLAVISRAWRMAQGLAATSQEVSPRIEHLRRACRSQCARPASALALRVELKHDWNDLVLPTAQLEQLHELCSHARYASAVYGAWCFERKLSLGKGLNALFSGPPGTGKTLAAEVIAADLGLDLLKIDLSQIVSKYIGETEKNLRQLFDQARGAHAILLFDEADALLGKRSEVKDAPDRYANTEPAYLLQKMEEYDGITILSTNLRQNIDDAFTRRMRFIVEFPFPDNEERLRIWERVWPQELPLDADADLPSFARQFRLSGGAIRNIALSAAFLAAAQGRPVATSHLMHATRRELQKMGRLISDVEQQAR
mgnify:CR=1 FL=1